MSKREQFVVRICGCCRDLDHFINFVADSRVDAVRLLERIGTLDDKAAVKRFLECGSDTNQFDRHDYMLYVESAGSCETTGTGRHCGAVMPISDR